jgi:PPOX class probable F420-dependent enzyme
VPHNLDLDALLRSERVARLATVDERGRPHIVPIVFAYVDGSIFTPLDRKPKAVAPLDSRRARNILASPDVQVLIDHYEEDWDRLWWVQVRGVAALLEGGPEYEVARTLLEEKYPQYRELSLEGRPLIGVQIRRIVSWGRVGEN